MKPRALAALAGSLVLAAGALTACSGSDAARQRVDYEARTRVRLVVNNLADRLVPAAEVFRAVAVSRSDLRVDGMVAEGTTARGRLVLRIFAEPERTGFAAASRYTACFVYRFGSGNAGQPEQVSCPAGNPLPVPTEPVLFRLPADARTRLLTTLQELPTAGRRSPTEVHSAVAGAFPEPDLRIDAQAGDGTAIGVVVMTPDLHVRAPGLACVLGRVDGTDVTVWQGAIDHHDPSLDCSALLVALGRLTPPS